MKKIIGIITMVFFVASVFAQHPSKPQRLGASGEIAAIGGNGFAYGGSIEYKYLASKNDLTATNVVGANILVGATLSEGIHLLIGGGYEQNLTYERGQPYCIAKFNTPIVVLSGKLLFSQFKGYSNDYEIAGTIFPGQNVVGIGVFYQTEYNCTNLGAKITFRFGKTNGGSSKKRNDCTICGL